MIFAALAGTLMTAVAWPAGAPAITNGQPDDGRHPYVGALVSHDGRDRKHHLICSGTLVSPTVFVTAAHCLQDEPSNLYVSFDAFVGAPDVGPEVKLHAGTAVGHPSFVDETAPGDTHDVAVVRLNAPVEGIEPAALPTTTSLPLAGAGDYELVGYGREGKVKNSFFGGGGRRFAFGAFSALEDFKLVLDQAGTTGGTCNGDSGGPVLPRDERTVLAVTSDGDPDCAVNGVYYRLDTASAREFLDDFVTFAPPPGTPDTPPAAAPAPPRVTASVRGRFRVSRRGALVRSLRVASIPAGGVVEVRCRAPRSRPRACPFKRRSASGLTTVELRSRFRDRRLPRGTLVLVRVFAPGASSREVRFRVGSRSVRRS